MANMPMHGHYVYLMPTEQNRILEFKTNQYNIMLCVDIEIIHIILNGIIK